MRVGPKGREELVSEEEYHRKLLVRVGPKGEVIIPRALGEAYRIVEGGYVFIEPTERGILLRGVEDPEEVVRWIRERRARVGGGEARLGELEGVDLEEYLRESSSTPAWSST